MAETDSKTPSPKLSKTPSWIMVGFIAGALFAYGVRRETSHQAPTKPEAPAAQAPASAAPQHSVSALKNRSSLSAVENIFTQYEGRAVWHNDLTEVALWNAETGKYSEFFEIMRSGDYYYFRTIPHLTRAVIRQNDDPNLPLMFTEPIDLQIKRLQENSSVWLPPSTEP